MLGDEKRKAICGEVALLLKARRIEQKLSMTALADRAGLSRQMVSYVEQGERNPTLDTLIRMTEVLGIRLEDIIREARDSSKRGN